MAFSEIKSDAISDNVFKLIGSEWMLITGGTLKSHNAMTASWGGLGVLWGKNVAFCFVRPQRYTHEFMDSGEYYTLSFFPENFKPALVVYGSTSGRDIDKDAETGLKAVPSPEGAVYYNEAKLVIVCKKLYADEFKPEKFTVSELDGLMYPARDHHTMYIGEIVRVLKDF